MSEHTFTPGPWKFCVRKDSIAAAPGLYEAAKAIEEWWLLEGQHAFSGAPAAMFMLRAAIAKAEGRPC